MGKTSAKQRYIQLSSWLETFKKQTGNTRKLKRQSRLEYYKSKQG